MAEDLDIEAMLEASYETKNDEINKERSSYALLMKSKSPMKEKLKNSLNDFKKCLSNLQVKQAKVDKSHRSRSRDLQHTTKSCRRSSNEKVKESLNKSKDVKKSKRSASRDRHLRRSSNRNKHSRKSSSKDKHSNLTKFRDRHGKRSHSKDKHSKRSKRSVSKSRRNSPKPKHKLSSNNIRKSRKSGSRQRSRSRGNSREIYRRSPPIELTAEEKDARTVFVWQLSSKIRTIDLEKFFSAIGKINDVRLIMDNKTRKSKGIAYVEFKNPESVSLALGLTGTRLLGVPIQVQPSQAEKNRAAQNTMRNIDLINKGPMRLCVGSLHQNISEDMLYKIFEPFGKIDLIKLMKDANGVSQSYAFITYHNAEEARRALEHMNNFEIAGKAIKVSHVANSTSENDIHACDNNDKLGIAFNSFDHLNFISKPPERANLSTQQTKPINQIPHVTTQCFVLSNMFDSNEEKDESFYDEIHDEIIEECNQHGGILHIYIDKKDPNGYVYIKCPSIVTATQCVSMLHGKSFSGRLITAGYVPLMNYHQLFSESITAKTLLKPRES